MHKKTRKLKPIKTVHTVLPYYLHTHTKWQTSIKWRHLLFQCIAYNLDNFCCTVVYKYFKNSENVVG